MRSRLITLKISAQLLETIDEAARANYSSRSNYIRESVAMRLGDKHLVPNPRPEGTLELLRHAGKYNGG